MLVLVACAPGSIPLDPVAPEEDLAAPGVTPLETCLADGGELVEETSHDLGGGEVRDLDVVDGDTLAFVNLLRTGTFALDDPAGATGAMLYAVPSVVDAAGAFVVMGDEYGWAHRFDADGGFDSALVGDMDGPTVAVAGETDGRLAWADAAGHLWSWIEGDPVALTTTLDAPRSLHWRDDGTLFVGGAAGGGPAIEARPSDLSEGTSGAVSYGPGPVLDLAGRGDAVVYAGGEGGAGFLGVLDGERVDFGGIDVTPRRVAAGPTLAWTVDGAGLAAWDTAFLPVADVEVDAISVAVGDTWVVTGGADGFVRRWACAE
ncbi:MAG: hypothetical protein ACOZNI_06065 [Myxococcota bacterium]